MATRKFEDVTKMSGAEASESTSVHYLPFKIQYEGAAKVKSLFSDANLPHPEIDGVLTNRFRGRPLTGKKINIPSEYEGVVLTDLKVSSALTVQHAEENDADALEDQLPPVHVTKRFDSLTYWNWDKAPSTMDAPMKLMDWLQLSQILHRPITK